MRHSICPCPQPAEANLLQWFTVSRMQACSHRLPPASLLSPLQEFSKPTSIDSLFCLALRAPSFPRPSQLTPNLIPYIHIHHRPIVVLAAPGRRHPGPCCHQVLSALANLHSPVEILQGCFTGVRGGPAHIRPHDWSLPLIQPPLYPRSVPLPLILFLLFCLSLLAVLRFFHNWPRPLPLRSGDPFIPFPSWLLRALP